MLFFFLTSGSNDRRRHIFCIFFSPPCLLFSFPQNSSTPTSSDYISPSPHSPPPPPLHTNTMVRNTVAVYHAAEGAHIKKLWNGKSTMHLTRWWQLENMVVEVSKAGLHFFCFSIYYIYVYIISFFYYYYFFLEINKSQNTNGIRALGGASSSSPSAARSSTQLELTWWLTHSTHSPLRVNVVVTHC